MNIHNKMRYWISLLLICCLLLTSCAKTAGSSEQAEEGPETWGLEPVFDYTVPVSMPALLVDQAGYLPESAKIVIGKGSKIPEDFEVINADTQKSVYSGQFIEKRSTEETEEPVYYGTFTELQNPGRYYIRADVVGCSYYFTIGRGCYDDSIDALQNLIIESKDAAGAELLEENDFSGGWITDKQGNKDVQAGCEAISYQLLTLELYPEFFEPEDAAGLSQTPPMLEEVREQIDWLLKLQDLKTGGVYAGLKKTETASSLVLRDITFEATAGFAGTLAKFSFLYQQYDYAYASDCLKAAARAWRYLSQMQTNENLWQMLFPAAELYRASNSSVYHNFILKNGVNLAKEDLSANLFFGEVTYLSTRRTVDKNVCSVFINSFMERSEKIAAAAKKNPYMIDDGGADDGAMQIQNVLQNMVDMTVTDFVITNYEYSTIIENQVHYLMGRNEEALCLVEGVGSHNITEAPESEMAFEDIADVSRMLLVLYGVIAEKEMITTQ